MFKTKEELEVEFANSPMEMPENEEEFNLQYRQYSDFIDRLELIIKGKIDLPIGYDINTHQNEWTDYRMRGVQSFIYRIKKKVPAHFVNHKQPFTKLLNIASVIIPEAMRLSAEEYPCDKQTSDFDKLESVNTDGWSEQEIIDYFNDFMKSVQIEDDSEFHKLYRLYCNIGNEFELSSPGAVFGWEDLFYLFAYINCTFMVRYFEQIKILKKLDKSEFEEIYYDESCAWWVDHEIDKELSELFENIQAAYLQAINAEILATHIITQKEVSKSTLAANAKKAALTSHLKEKRFLKKCIELYDEKYTKESFRKAAHCILNDLSNDSDRLYDVDNPAGKSYANSLERWLSLWSKFKCVNSNLDDFLSMTKTEIRAAINK